MLVVFGKDFESEDSVVGREVVNHYHLKIGVVLLKKVEKVCLEVVGVILHRHDHRHRREGRGGRCGIFFRSCAFAASHPHIKKAIVEAKYDKGKSKKR